jgi:hypothetical protein
MNPGPFRDFETFWPYYLGEHRLPMNRWLHFVGTTLVLCAAGALLVSRQPVWFLAMPLCGYGWAWVGHFVVERNRPATFRHPLWSLRGDFRMYRLMLVGRLGPELERAGVR